MNIAPLTQVTLTGTEVVARAESFDPLTALMLLLLFAGSLRIIITDVRGRTIETWVVVALFLSCLGLAATRDLTDSEHTGGTALTGALVALAVFVIALLFTVVNPRGLGGGDTKLLALCAAALTWLAPAAALLAVAAVAVAVLATALWVSLRRSTGTQFALAPHLIGATWLAIAGDALTRA